MTSRPRITAFVANRADFPVIGKIHDPDFFDLVLFVEFIDILFEERPIDRFATINRPGERVPAIGRH